VTLGAGFAKAGTSPAGFGAPSVAPVNQTTPFPDPLTGLGQTGALINYQTGDYVYTADGRVAGMSSVPQLVLIALMNGNIFAGLLDKTPDYPRQVATRVQTALSSFIRQGWVALVSVDVVEAGSGSPDAAGVNVRWRDLTAPAPGSGARVAQTTLTTTIPTS
jgi:hypothetical protein